MNAVRYLAPLAVGLVIGGFFGAMYGWLDRDKEARVEQADIVKKANAALDAIALETALAFAPADFAEWESEMREETP